MKKYLERLREGVWRYKQPLTQIPNSLGASVSDLFIWRNSPEWETFFELTNLPALFAKDDWAASKVTLMFFDAAGRLFFENEIQIPPGRRQTLALSSLVGTDNGVSGTFSVFHSCTPLCLQKLGSHIAERGYVSYRYRGIPLRSYVHGNLDAIARLPDRRLQLLGGQSFLRRRYSLQYALGVSNSYDLGIVNPTARKQRFICRTLSTGGAEVNVEAAELLPRGSHIFRVLPDEEQQRIVVDSRLIMARPLVFRIPIQGQSMDVFHG